MLRGPYGQASGAASGATDEAAVLRTAAAAVAQALGGLLDDRARVVVEDAVVVPVGAQRVAVVGVAMVAPGRTERRTGSAPVDGDSPAGPSSAPCSRPSRGGWDPCSPRMSSSALKAPVRRCLRCRGPYPSDREVPAMTPIPMPGPAPQPRRFSRWGRRAAGAYLLVVLAVVLFVAWALVTHDPADGANFAPVWLLLVTMPVSSIGPTLLALSGSDDGGVARTLVVASALSGAALNTWLLYVIGSALERGRRTKG